MWKDFLSVKILPKSRFFKDNKCNYKDLNNYVPLGTLSEFKNKKWISIIFSTTLI